jgi:hypothetical protein
MKHYKDSQNKVFGFSEGQEVPSGLTEISIEEARELGKLAFVQDQNLMNYAQKRALEYPLIGDQLDALWKGGAEGQNSRS